MTFFSCLQLLDHLSEDFRHILALMCDEAGDRDGFPVGRAVRSAREQDEAGFAQADPTDEMVGVATLRLLSCRMTDTRTADVSNPAQARIVSILDRDVERLE